ncbi:MAG: hypothetical protein AVDCRST_MAG04-1121, partial [uncultured Acetobacteraceae bacterium]
WRGPWPGWGEALTWETRNRVAPAPPTTPRPPHRRKCR